MGRFTQKGKSAGFGLAAWLILGVAIAAGQAPSAAKAPLSRFDVAGLLAAGIRPGRIAQLIGQSGTSFVVSNDEATSLRAGGTSDGLLTVLRGTAARGRPGGESLESQADPKTFLHLTEAAALIAQKRYTDAERECRAALNEGSASAWVHIALGRLLFLEAGGRKRKDPERSRELDEGLQELQTGLHLAFAYADAHLAYGEALESVGQFRLALSAFSKAVELEPDYLDALAHFAFALGVTGQWASAQKEFEKVIQLDPTNVSAHFGLGTMLEEQGKTQEAKEQYRIVRDLDPDFPPYKKLPREFKH